MKKTLFLILSMLILTACPQPGEKINFVKLTTTHGDIKLMLYNETPQHRDNFIKLVKEGFYDGIFFHRIIEGFMIQTGNPETKSNFVEGTDISRYRYTIPAEIVPGLYHRKGAVAAARMGDQSNPLKASSGTQFYIVHGRTWDEEGVEQQQTRINSSIKNSMYYRFMAEEKAAADSSGIQLTNAEIQERASLKIYDYFENKPDYEITEEQRTVYASEGGAPHLDMNYTVFGMVIEGLDVIDKIAAEERDRSDKPLSDNVRIIKAEIVKK